MAKQRGLWVLAFVGLLTASGNGAAVAPLLTSLGPALSAADEREDTTIYKVVMNHEEQYSIWPADRENALGWTDAGKTGTKAECLAWIKEVWTDMRPESLRKAMEARGGTSQPAATPAPASSPPAAPPPTTPEEPPAAQAPAAEQAAAAEEEEEEEAEAEEAAEPEESAEPEEAAEPEDWAAPEEEAFADEEEAPADAEEAPADAEEAAEDATDSSEEAGCVDESGEPVEGPCE